MTTIPYNGKEVPVPVPELEHYNTDREVSPPVMVRGSMHKTSGGSWVYSGDNNPNPVKISNGTDVADVIPTNGSNGLVTLSPGHISIDNSTAIVLEADDSWIGEWEDITNFGIIVVTVIASNSSATDGLQVDFSSDGINIDSCDVYTITAGIGKTFSFQAATKYFRVRYTNGDTLQTYFRLQTILKPYYVKPSSHRINDAIIGDDDAELIKSVLTGMNDDNVFVNVLTTNAGALKIAITDNYGFGVENTPMDELRTIIPVRLVGANFVGATLDTNFWTSTATDSGTVVQSGGQVTLATGTTADSTTSIQSVRRGRYTGGSSLRYRAVIQLTDGETGTADNIRRWGAYDVNDGAFFELDGTTLNIVTRKATSDTEVEASSWNGESFTIDNYAHTYEIYWTNSKVYFVIDGILRHTVSATSSTWTSTTSLPIRAENYNTNGLDDDIVLSVRVQTIYRLGNLSTQPTSKYQSGTTAGLILKRSAGNLHGAVISGVVNNSVITLYDNTAASGTVIWSSGAMGSQTQPFNLDFGDLLFSNGLTLVISGANSNITIIYE